MWFNSSFVINFVIVYGVKKKRKKALYIGELKKLLGNDGLIFYFCKLMCSLSKKKKKPCDKESPYSQTG